MPKQHLIVDAHQDLAWNILTFGRDYSTTVDEIRAREEGTIAPQANGDTLIGWDAYQMGRVAIVFSTLFAGPDRAKEGEWDILSYENEADAYSKYRQQADVYHKLVETYPNKFTLIRSQVELNEHLFTWKQLKEGEEARVGLVIAMEGADGIGKVEEIEQWWELGVRTIGPAWCKTRFCGGTREPGPLTKEGYHLLDMMADTGFALDISHMDEQAVLQALDYFPGWIIASHANAQALLKNLESNRFLSDRVISGLIERDAVIGVVPFNRFLDDQWATGMPKELVSIQRVVDQIDYMCQIAGDARHVGIGSDADGGFGVQSTPAEMDSIADLQKLAPLLAEKGYSEEDTAAILGGNWIKFLAEALPENL